MSEEYSQIFSKLREGLYVISEEEFPKQGYYVSMGTNTVTFVACYVNERFYAKCPDELQQFSFRTAESNLRDFLRCFLQRYRPLGQNPILVYRFSNTGIFFINPVSNLLLWTDDETYEIKKHCKCEIKKPRFFGESFFGLNGIHLFLEDNNRVILRYYNRKYKLEPRSLESHLLYDHSNFDRKTWKEHSSSIGEKLCQFKISLEQRKEISVSMSISQLSFYRFYNDHDLFNRLSKSIEKTFLELVENKTEPP